MDSSVLCGFCRLADGMDESGRGMERKSLRRRLPVSSADRFRICLTDPQQGGKTFGKRSDTSFCRQFAILLSEG